MTNGLKKYTGRTLAFLVIPGTFTLLAKFAWPLVYPTIYIFYPFLGYGETNTDQASIKGDPTIFAVENYGWHFSIGYLLLLTIFSVYITRRLSLPGTLAFFVLFYWLGAIILHGFMSTTGYHYYVESP